MPQRKKPPSEGAARKGGPRRGTSWRGADTDAKGLREEPRSPRGAPLVDSAADSGTGPSNAAFEGNVRQFLDERKAARTDLPRRHSTGEAVRRGGPSRSRHGRPFAKEMRRLRERESAWDENFARQPKSTAQANLSSPLARASVWLREKPDGRARKNGSRGKDKRSRNLESGWRDTDGTRRSGIPDLFSPEKERRRHLQADHLSVDPRSEEGEEEKGGDAEGEREESRFELVPAPRGVVDMYRLGQLEAVVLHGRYIVLPPERWPTLPGKRRAPAAKPNPFAPDHVPRIPELSKSPRKARGRRRSRSPRRSPRRSRSPRVQGSSGQGAGQVAKSSPRGREAGVAVEAEQNGDASEARPVAHHLARNGPQSHSMRQQKQSSPPADASLAVRARTSSRGRRSPRTGEEADVRELPFGKVLYIKRRRLRFPFPLSDSEYARCFGASEELLRSSPCRKPRPYMPAWVEAKMEEEGAEGKASDSDAEEPAEEQEQKRVDASMEEGKVAEQKPEEEEQEQEQEEEEAKVDAGSPKGVAEEEEGKEGAGEDAEAEEKAIVSLQARARGRLSRKQAQQRREDQAAVRIQAGARGRLSRKQVQQRREEERAAVRIQAGARGRLSRKQMQKRREEERAAVRIQAAARGRMGQRAVRDGPGGEGKEGEGKEDEDGTERAAVRIQAGARGYLSRAERRRKEKAAVRIQAGARGRLSRKQVRQRREEEKAAVRIQAGARGRLARRRAKPRWAPSIGPEEAATRLQRIYRGHAARQTTKKELLDQTGIMEGIPGITVQGETGWYQDGSEVFFFQVLEEEGEDGEGDVEWHLLVGPMPVQDWQLLRRAARRSDVMLACPPTEQGTTGYYVSKEMVLCYCEVSEEGEWRLSVIG